LILFVLITFDFFRLLLITFALVILIIGCLGCGGLLDGTETGLCVGRDGMCVFFIYLIFIIFLWWGGELFVGVCGVYIMQCNAMQCNAMQCNAMRWVVAVWHGKHGG
jgi:hypothetical protein